MSAASLAVVTLTVALGLLATIRSKGEQSQDEDEVSHDSQLSIWRSFHSS
jgi:hypothetical protein